MPLATPKREAVRERRFVRVCGEVSVGRGDCGGAGEVNGCVERRGRECWRTDLGVVLDAFLDDGRDSELALGGHVGCGWEEHPGMERGVGAIWGGGLEVGLLESTPYGIIILG